MNKYQKIALGVMLGVPAFFAVISLVTGNWLFLLYSLLPSFLAGMTSFFAAKNTNKN